MVYSNFRSCRNKTEDIFNLVIDNNTDIGFITETWLHSTGDEPIIADITPPGYKLQSFPRTSGRGGGIAVLSRETIPLKLINYQQHTTFEHCAVQLGCSPAVNCVCIYRPPPNAKNRYTFTQFLDELSSLLDYFNKQKPNVLICGDFNVHYQSGDSYDIQTRSLINQYDISQLVNTPTHRMGHIIDWVLVNQVESQQVSDLRVEDKTISDHYVILFNLTVQSRNERKVKVTSRNIKRVNHEKLKNDIKILVNSDTSQIDIYETGLRQLLDLHAPEKTRTITAKPSAPWLTDDILAAKRERKQFERQWRKSGLNVHRQMYVNKKNSVNNLLKYSKRTYFRCRIKEAKSSKELHHLTNSLLGRPTAPTLPDNVPNLPEKFSAFFVNKIDTIRNDILQSQNQTILDYGDTFLGNPLDVFKTIKVSDIENIISRSPKKSCDLDPLPIDLLMANIDILIPLITDLINTSLSTGTVPANFKHAIVAPVLKKTGLDPDVLKNYRPVSNLSFVSKILERVVMKQLMKHLTENNLLEPLQSAYRANHSTETALTRVVSDLLRGIDGGQVAVLALLDLSAAFDTIDHQVLLGRLEHNFGFTGVALAWLRSYVYDRSQQVKTYSDLSSVKILMHGVPQGSVLGPILFSLYMSPLGRILSKHNMSFHFYADDTQLYTLCHIDKLEETVVKMKSCINEIANWLSNNMLKVNTEKTEVLILHPKQKKLEKANITFSNNVTPSETVKNLGVVLDSQLSMEKQISNVCRGVYLEVRRLSHIRGYLSRDVANKLATCFISPKIDYCNTLYSGLPDKMINKLQRAQNSAARLVAQIPRYESCRASLRELHWLPVKNRIIFKVACHCYRALNGSAPQYILDLINRYFPKRSLRSSSKNLLHVPKTKLKTFGQRSFHYFGPVVWNSLPGVIKESPSLDIFKKCLKTYLFSNDLLIYS